MLETEHMRQFVLALIAVLALPAAGAAEEPRRASRNEGRSREGVRVPAKAARPVTSPGAAGRVVPPGNGRGAATAPGNAGWKPRFDARAARGVGLSPIGLPPIGLDLPSHEFRRPHFDKDGHARRYWRPSYRHVGGTQVVYLGYWTEPFYGINPFNDYYPAPGVVEPARTARLILDVEPANAQVFANGYYIGLPEDLRGEQGGANLAPGEYKIEIVAPGYEQVTFDVRLDADQALTYRQMLKPVADTPAPRPVPAPLPAKASPPATFYIIPGCYMGNVAPKDANLPASCDLSKAVEKKY